MIPTGKGFLILLPVFKKPPQKLVLRIRDFPDLIRNWIGRCFFFSTSPILDREGSGVLRPHFLEVCLDGIWIEKKRQMLPSHERCGYLQYIGDDQLPG